MSSPGIPTSVAAKLTALREPETQERLAKLGLVMVDSPQSGLIDVLQRRGAQLWRGRQRLGRGRRVARPAVADPWYPMESG